MDQIAITVDAIETVLPREAFSLLDPAFDPAWSLEEARMDRKFINLKTDAEFFGWKVQVLLIHSKKAHISCTRGAIMF